MTTLAQRYSKLKSELGATELLAVSKYSGVKEIAELYNLGHQSFGENRVEQCLERSLSCQNLGLDKIQWHLIGSIQTNKLNKLLTIPNLVAIHSIDRLELLSKLYQKADLLLAPLDFFLQVKTSDEEEKQGFENEQELQEAYQYCRESAHPKLRLVGLMTMAKIRTENYEREARASFKKLKDLRDQLDPSLKLSMGMSGDYKWALEYGTSIVRVGSYLFEGA